jgi:hypothetical protein
LFESDISGVVSRLSVHSGKETVLVGNSLHAISASFKAVCLGKLVKNNRISTKCNKERPPFVTL